MKKQKQVTVNQHYVPQFYLKHFSYENKKGKKCIDVLDLDLNKTLKKQRIENVASENYFYDIDLEHYLKDTSSFKKIIISIFLKFIFGIKFKLSSFKRLNIVEHKLGNIESKASPILVELIDKANGYTLWEIENCYLISDENKLYLSLYLAIQFLRTPKTRQTIYEVNTYLKPKLIKEFHYRESGEILELNDLIEEINKENIKQQHLDFFHDNSSNEMANVFYKHSWIFYKNTTDVDFITSDSPISIRLAHDETLMSYGGINSSGVMILFPISKKLLLVMYQEDLNQSAYNRKLMICSDPEVVEAYNTVIFLNCHRFLYGQEKELRKFDDYVELHRKSTDPKMVIANSMIPEDK